MNQSYENYEVFAYLIEFFKEIPYFYLTKGGNGKLFAPIKPMFSFLNVKLPKFFKN